MLVEVGDDRSAAAIGLGEVDVGLVDHQHAVDAVGQPAQLVLPTDTRIRFVETSPDVIHSFYVPAFLFKRDVIPGRANTFEIEITKEGEYIGRCAELCGEKHSAMNFLVRAVPMEKYEQYVAQLKQDPTNRISETGQGAVVLKSESTEGDVS